MSTLINLLMVFLIMTSAGVQAAVSLSGTRLIFDGNLREASIEANNRSGHEVLLQAWLSDAQDIDAGESSDLPFIVTPHLWHLQANGRQALRIMYEGVGMPLDQESLLHLYVMEIPRSVAGENQLSIAIRQRINVFYRPRGLVGDPARTGETLLWSLTRDDDGARVLQVSNPTAYHASLQHLRLDGRAGNQHVSDYQLLPPGVTRNLPLAGVESEHVQWKRLSFKALTDYGGQREYRADIAGTLPFNARLLPDADHFKEVQP